MYIIQAKKKFTMKNMMKLLNHYCKKAKMESFMKLYLLIKTKYMFLKIFLIMLLY